MFKKHLTIHATEASYDSTKGTLLKPQVAFVQEDNNVHYVPLVKVNNVLLNKNNLSLAPNITETLVATVLPANASDKSVIWTSSDESVATVSENGVVTAVGNIGDSAIITVTTVDGGYSAQCTTEVNDYVDLGLPSGLLWCTHNVGATNSEDAGLYFAWGETTGYADAAARNTALGRSDGFSSDAYTATGGAAITDMVLSLEHDAAQANMGLDWRIPTQREWQELISNTDLSLYVLQNPIRKFVKVMKKTDHNIFIVLPLKGRYDGNTHQAALENGYYQTATHAEAMWGAKNYPANVNSILNITIYSAKYCYLGNMVRAVREAPKAIDLGLPSGTLWADRNVGATAPEDYGSYFSWGNVDGHKSSNGSTFDDGYNSGESLSGPYASTPGASIPFVTNNKEACYTPDSGNDAASENLRGSWRVPTANEIEELVNNTDTEWSTVNGINGRKFMKKTDHSIYIFIPAGGQSWGSALNIRGSFVRFYSSSLSCNEYGYSYSSNSTTVNECSDDTYRFIALNIRAVQ